MLAFNDNKQIELEGIVADIEPLSVLAYDAYSRWFSSTPESVRKDERRQDALIDEYGVMSAQVRILALGIDNILERLNKLVE